MLFLIDYDRRAGKIVAMRVFEDSQHLEAREARLELELAFNRTGTEREVVLLDAIDEAAVRRSHRRYFADLAELASLPGTNGDSAGH
jgi:hypothetical protein